MRRANPFAFPKTLIRVISDVTPEDKVTPTFAVWVYTWVVMVHDPNHSGGVNHELGEASQPVAVISIDQAVRVAFQHARENRAFYGRHAGSELLWWYVSAEETSDHYAVRLSYSPSPGVPGPVGHRAIYHHQVRARRGIP